MRGMWVFWFVRSIVVATIVLEYRLSIKPFFDFGIDAYTIEEISRGVAPSTTAVLGNNTAFFSELVSLFSIFIIGYCAVLLSAQVLGERTNPAMKHQNRISFGFVLVCILYLWFLFSPLGYAMREWSVD